MCRSRHHGLACNVMHSPSYNSGLCSDMQAFINVCLKRLYHTMQHAHALRDARCWRSGCSHSSSSYSRALMRLCNQGREDHRLEAVLWLVRNASGILRLLGTSWLICWARNQKSAKTTGDPFEGQSCGMQPEASKADDKRCPVSSDSAVCFCSR